MASYLDDRASRTSWSIWKMSRRKWTTITASTWHTSTLRRLSIKSCTNTCSWKSRPWAYTRKPDSGSQPGWGAVDNASFWTERCLHGLASRVVCRKDRSSDRYCSSCSSMTWTTQNYSTEQTDTMTEMFYIAKAKGTWSLQRSGQCQCAPETECRECLTPGNETENKLNWVKNIVYRWLARTVVACRGYVFTSDTAFGAVRRKQLPRIEAISQLRDRRPSTNTTPADDS